MIFFNNGAATCGIQTAVALLKRLPAAVLPVAAAFALSAQGADTAGPALESLTLIQAEQLMLQKNREIVAARRLAEASEADALSASAAPNPELSIGTSRISPRLGIGPGRLSDKRMDTVIGVSQLFERGNKRELRTEAAQSIAAAARIDEHDMVRQQRLALNAAYFDLLLAQERLKIARNTAGLFDKSVAAAERRLNAGDIAATDLARIRVDALRARNDMRSAEAELERARLALSYLIGTEKDAPRITAADAWPSPAAAERPVAADSVLENRADIRAARERVKAAEKNRDLARALLTRDVTAGLQYERFPGDSANNSYGFVVSVPLYTRNLYTGEIRRAEVELDSARDSLERITAIALNDIRRAEAEAAAAAERVSRLETTLLPTAEKAAKGAEFAYERGAIGLMDLLDARRQFHAVRIESVTAQAEYAKALAARRSATDISSK